MSASASRFGSGAFSRYVTAADLGSAVGPLIGWMVVAELGDPMWSLALGGACYLLAVLAISGKQKNVVGLGIW